METVEELVLALDEAADSAARVQVVKVNSSVDIRLIQEKLSKLLGQKAATPKANGRQGNQPGQQALQGQQAIQNNPSVLWQATSYLWCGKEFRISSRRNSGSSGSRRLVDAPGMRGLSLIVV